MTPVSPAAVPQPLLALRDVLGETCVLIGEDVPERNRNDWSTQPPTHPLAVVRPVDAAGVSAALKACRAAG
ncbi:MAG TPA: FAD-binding oxidoreductase, partial [Variovorax sp.]|nr:FAD-binding oxidoreductase [Variovorax sp.]